MGVHKYYSILFLYKQIQFLSTSLLNYSVFVIDKDFKGELNILIWKLKFKQYRVWKRKGKAYIVM